MANFEDLITKIESLTVVELSELVKKLEEKFGISAAAMAAGPAAGAGAAAEEKDELQCRLEIQRSQQVERHQGCPRSDHSWSQGSEGPRRWRTEDGQRERQEGRSRRDQEKDRRGRRNSDDRIVRSRSRNRIPLQ